MGYVDKENELCKIIMRGIIIFINFAALNCLIYENIKRL